MKPSKSALPAGAVHVTLLGGFSLERGGAVLTDEVNRSHKPWSVLAYLILHRERAVPQSELIELFWADESQANPGGALKTMLYRIRAMLKPLFGDEQPIAARRGSYRWNPDIPCALDIDAFESLCLQAGKAAGGAKALSLCRRAAALYRGDLLPRLGGQMWLLPLSARYHALYLDTAKALASLLEAGEQFEEMERVCSRAVRVDSLDEDLHTLIVRALLRQGKNAAALRHYESATDLLYTSFGVRPSESLRALYQEIMSSEKELEADLGVILGDLREAAARPGAFICAYGFFAEAYRLEARRAARNGVRVHICLITAALPNGEVPPLCVLTPTMEQLLSVLTGCLRRGDVVSRFSGSQYVVMLPAASFEDSSLVMDRVVASFYRRHKENFLKLTVLVREMEPV